MMRTTSHPVQALLVLLATSAVVASGQRAPGYVDLNPAARGGTGNRRRQP
jgi:hypothetical protein